MGNVVNILDIEKIIEEQEKYINTLYKNEKYEMCYESCSYLLSLLPEDKKLQRKVKKFCYLRQAVCLRKMKKYDEALGKAKIALKYCVIEDDKYSIFHLKAIVYKNTGHHKKALLELNKCIKWYKRNAMHYELAMMYDIKGSLTSNEQILFQALAEYDAAYEDGKYFDKEMLEKEKYNTYQRLVTLYVKIGEENMIKAYKALNNIKDEIMYKESKSKIQNLYGKELN